MSKQLGDLKKEVLRRKRRIRNAAPSRKQFVIDEYLRVKPENTAEAGKAQTESWKEFCWTQDRESMWGKIYRVIRKSSRR